MSKKSILTIHREIGKNKYNKAVRTNPPVDVREEYEIMKDGWRRKKVQNEK